MVTASSHILISLVYKQDVPFLVQCNHQAVTYISLHPVFHLEKQLQHPSDELAYHFELHVPELLKLRGNGPLEKMFHHNQCHISGNTPWPPSLP